MLPSGPGASDTKVSTPTTWPRSFTDAPAAWGNSGGGGVGLDQRVVVAVLLEPGDGAAGHRGRDRGRLIEELVGEHHAREADDMDRVADLGRSRIREGKDREGLARHLEQGEIPARHLTPLTARGRAVLLDLGRETAIGGDHEHLGPEV